jgi:hypothetical protein
MASALIDDPPIQGLLLAESSKSVSETARGALGFRWSKSRMLQLSNAIPDVAHASLQFSSQFR